MSLEQHPIQVKNPLPALTTFEHNVLEDPAVADDCHLLRLGPHEIPGFDPGWTGLISGVRLPIRFYLALNKPGFLEYAALLLSPERWLLRRVTR